MRAILVRGSEDCLGGVESFPTFTLDTPNYFWYNRDRRIMGKHITAEEKVAIKIGDLVADLRLDLDQVGIYLARHKPSINYNRLQEIADSAYYERANQAMGRNELSDNIDERFRQYAQQDTLF